ncbi:MAG: thioredoxin family protein [Gammaproteobacteria bacterium]|nr:thioredoxin family protein [Gammaproteobacteria bacterium]
MTAALIFDVDVDAFAERVLGASHATPLLVDFWADWCAPCHAISPHLAQVVADLGGRVRLAKVEVDVGDNMKLAGRYQVRGFPTVMLIRDGDELARFSGARAASWIERWIDEYLPG